MLTRNKIVEKKTTANHLYEHPEIAEDEDRRVRAAISFVKERKWSINKAAKKARLVLTKVKRLVARMPFDLLNVMIINGMTKFYRAIEDIENVGAEKRRLDALGGLATEVTYQWSKSEYTAILFKLECYSKQFKASGSGRQCLKAQRYIPDEEFDAALNGKMTGTDNWMPRMSGKPLNDRAISKQYTMFYSMRLTRKIDDYTWSAKQTRKPMCAKLQETRLQLEVRKNVISTRSCSTRWTIQ